MTIFLKPTSVFLERSSLFPSREGRSFGLLQWRDLQEDISGNPCVAEIQVRRTAHVTRETAHSQDIREHAEDHGPLQR